MQYSYSHVRSHEITCWIAVETQADLALSWLQNIEGVDIGMHENSFSMLFFGTIVWQAPSNPI